MPEHAVVFGPAENGTYSQAAIFGNYYVALSLSGDLKAGHDTLSRIEEIILESNSISCEELVASFPDINVVVAKIEDNILKIAAQGKIEAKLIRNEKIINLAINLPAGRQVTGPVKSDDILVLGTETFFDQLFTKDIFEKREDLALQIDPLENRAEIAAVLLRIHDIAEPIFIPEEKKSFDFVPPKSRRTLYAVLLAFIFLISIVSFQLRSRGLEQRTKLEIKIEKQARDGLDSAKKLTGLNDNLARDVLNQTKKDLTSQINENNFKSPKLDSVLTDVNKELNLVSHQYTLNTLETFSDFSLLRAGANITSASLYENEIAALDSANGAVYSLGTKTKTAAILGGAEDFKKDSFVDFVKKDVYVFTPQGIYKNNKQLIKPTDKWGQIKGLKTFAGNLYLLDSANHQIWKYQGTDFGFDNISYYLKGSVDFTNVVSFAIDGTITVLSNTGNVAQFANGNAADFNITGLDTPLKNPISIYTSDETKNIYILDSNRVVILDKKGIYQAQYLLTQNDFKIILADEIAKKVFLISESKVYSFDLK